MSNFPIQTNIPIFHHSIIPFGLHETCSIKNALISVSCRISDTLNYLLQRGRKITISISVILYKCFSKITINNQRAPSSGKDNS